MQNFTEALALLWIFNLSGNSTHFSKRHQHKIATRQTEVRRDSRPLGSNRPLVDLNNHFRSWRIKSRDIVARDPWLAASPAFALHRFNLLIHRSRYRIPEMQKPVFLQSDINKKSLQGRLDVVNPGLVDAPGNTAVSVTLDGELLHHSSLQEGDSLFQRLHRKKQAPTLLPFFQTKDPFDRFQYHVVFLSWDKGLSISPDAFVAIRFASIPSQPYTRPGRFLRN